MKKISFVLAIAALFTVGAGFAGARSAAKHTVTPVTVVMHDPGCHWFSVSGKFLKTLSVTGTARLTNLDEAALIVKGPHRTLVARAGKPVVLGKGAYRITMVKQASDDNILRLVVR